MMRILTSRIDRYGRAYFLKHMCPCLAFPSTRSCVCETCERVALLLAAIRGARRKWRKKNNGKHVWEICDCPHCKKKKASVDASAAALKKLDASEDGTLEHLFARIVGLAASVDARVAKEAEAAAEVKAAAKAAAKAAIAEAAAAATTSTHS